MHRRIIGSLTSSCQRSTRLIRGNAKREPTRSWCRPELVILEDRTLPSTLDFTGSNLTWNAFAAGTANNVALTLVGANYVFTDSAEIINFGPGVPGSWSGTGTNSVTGPVASVSSITIDGGAGAAALDTLAINSALSVPGLVSITRFNFINVNQPLTTTVGGTVTLSAADTATASLTVAAAINPSGVAILTGRGTLTTTAAIVTNNRDLTLIGDSISVGATLSAGTLTVAFEPFTASRTIDVGTETAGRLGLTDAELDLITAGTAVRVGRPTHTGGIQVTAAITAPAAWSTLIFRNTGTTTQTVGSSVAVTNLVAQNNGGVILDQPGNNVVNLAGRTIGTAFRYRDADAVTVSQLGGVNGIGTTNGDVTLCTNAGAINLNRIVNAGTGTVRLCPQAGVSQTAQGVITAANLGVLAGGNIDLDVATNQVNGVFAANNAGVGGFTDFLSAVGLTIDTVTPDPMFAGATGVTTSNGNITVTVDNLTISNAVSTSSLATGIVTFQPRTTARLVTLGTEVAGTLALTDAELDQVTANVLRIGRTNAGTIDVTAAVSLLPTTLSLITAGAITQSPGGSLSANTLAMRAANGIGAITPLTTAVTNLAYSNSAANAVQINNTGALTLNNADTLTSATNAGGSTTLTAGSPITFAINASSLISFTATANENPVPTANVDNITVNAGITVQATNGNAVFQAGDRINTNAGSIVRAQNGSVSFVAGFTDNDADAAMSLNGDVTANLATGVVTLQLVVNGTVNQIGGAVTAAELLLLGTGTFTFNLAGNDVDEIAAAIVGSLVYRDADTVTVGTVSTTSGIVSGGGNITLCSDNGDILLDEPINAGAAIVRLQAFGSVVQQTSNAIITTAELGVRAGANINLGLVANQVTSIIAANAGGSLVFRNAGAFAIGAVPAADCFTGASGFTGVGDVTICVDAGDLSINSPLSGTTVRLQVAGSVSQTGAGLITATDLGVNAGGSIDLHTVANQVTDEFAATTIIAGGFIRFLNMFGFTVGDVDPATCFLGAVGVQTTDSNITLQNQTGNMFLNLFVNAGAGTVRLTSGGAITQSAAGIITAAALGVDADNNVILDSANVVATAAAHGIFAAQVANPLQAIVFRDVASLIVGTITDNGFFTLVDGITTKNGNLTLNIGTNLFVNSKIALGMGQAIFNFNLAVLPFIEAAFNNIDVMAASARVVGSAATTDMLSMNYPLGSVFTIDKANAGQAPLPQGNVKLNMPPPKILPTNGLEFVFIEFFNGDAGPDTFNVTVTSLGFTTTLNGEDDNDVFNLGSPTSALDALDAPVFVDGGTSDNDTTSFACGANPVIQRVIGNTLNLQDQANANDGNYTLNTAGFARDGGVSVSLVDVQTLQLRTGTGNNIVDVLNTNPQTFTEIIGSSGNVVGLVETEAFNILGTGAGSNLKIAAEGGKNTITVGSGILSNILGNICADGGPALAPADSPDKNLTITTDCGTKSNTLEEGQILNFNDASHSQPRKYSLSATNFLRTFINGAVDTALVTYSRIGTINLNTGTAGNTIVIGSTAAQTNTNVLTRMSADTVTVLNTGASSNTEIKAGVGFDILKIQGTGPNSVTIARGENGNDNLELTGNGANSGVQLGGGFGNDTLRADMTQSGANSIVFLKGGEGTDTFSVKFKVGGPPGGTVAVDGEGGDDVLKFENFDALPEPKSITPTGTNSGTVQSQGALLLCFKNIDRVPLTGFQAAAFLLPTKNPTSGKPEIAVVFTGNLAVERAEIDNTPFAPIIAQPNPTSPFGFSPPTVAIGDVDQDSIPDLIVAMGSGYAPLVTVFSGASIFSQDSASTPKIIAEFFAFGTEFAGGVYVAAGNLDGSATGGILGQPHIVTGAGRGVKPGEDQLHVFKLDPARPYDKNKFPGGGVTLLPNYPKTVYPNFTGGVRVAAGNVNKTGFDDIITGAGPGGGPHVIVYDGQSKAVIGSFMAYGNFTGGVFVSAGRYDNDDFADVMTAPGFGGGPNIKVFNGAQVGLPNPPTLADFTPISTVPLGGVIGGADYTSAGLSGVAFGSSRFVNGEQQPGLVVGSGLGQPAELRTLNPTANLKFPKLESDTFFTLNDSLVGFADTFDAPNVIISGVSVAGIFI